MNDLNIPLHPYQEYAKEFIKNTPSAGLFLDCGLGKTLITLMALYEMNPSGHVLIIAPKNIARSTWLDEIHKWNIPLRTRSLIVNDNGKDLSRQKRLERYAEIPKALPTVYFISRDLLTDLTAHMPIENNRPVLWTCGQRSACKCPPCSRITG